MASLARKKELRILIESFESCVRATGGGVLVHGGLATGKTELLRSLTDHAAKRGALVLTAVGSRAEQSLPFGLITQLGPYHADLGETGRQLATLVDSTALVLAPCRAECDSMIRAEAQVIHQVSTALLSLCAERPVVLGIDDIQYADSFSLQCLLHLARRLHSAQIFMVLNDSSYFEYKNLSFHTELLRQPTCQRMRLEPLDRLVVEELLAEHVDAVTARRLAPAYHELTGGNLLLLNGLLEDNATRGTARPTPGAAFGEAVLTSLYRGSRQMHETARTLAVLGHASSSLLADVLGANNVRAVLRELVRSGLLRPDFRFRHPAIHAAVLKDVTPEQHEAIQHRAATVLHSQGASADVIAPHLMAMTMPRPPWATLVLREAAEQALANDDVRRCRDYLEMASRTGDGRQRVATLASLSNVEWRTDPARALEHLPRLMEALRERLLPFEHACALTTRLFSQGRLDEGVAALSQLTEMVSPPDEAAAAEFRFFCCWLAATFPAVLNQLPPALYFMAKEEAEQPWAAKPAKLQAAELLYTVLSNHSSMDVPLFTEMFLNTWRLNNSTIKALNSAIMAAVYSDRLDIAEPWCERLVGEAKDRDANGWHAATLASRAEIAFRRGRLAAADQYANTALRLIPAESWGVAIGGPLAIRILANTGMGRFDIAAMELDRLPLNVMLQTRYGLNYLRARGHFYLATGETRAAMADFRAYGNLMTDWRIDLPAFLPWRSDLARCYLRLGEPDHARLLVTDELDRIDRTLRRTYGVALRLFAATLPAGERCDPLQDAIELLEECGDMFELGLAVADLGRTYEDLGRPCQAKTANRRARKLLQHNNAGPAKTAGVVASDGKPDDQDLSVLSEAELRVAALAAQGHTNREISSRLYITISTVEQHLTRVYRKLRVKRRTDLPAELQSVWSTTGITKSTSTPNA